MSFPRALLAALLVVAASASPAAHSATNQLANGSFEQRLSGWAPRNAIAGVRAGGTHGSHYARAVRKRGSAFGLAASSRKVVLPLYQRLALRASIRAARGMPVCLRVEERVGARRLGTARRCLRASGAWQRPAAVVYAVRGRGSRLVVSVLALRSAGRARLDVDHVVLRTLRSTTSRIYWGALPGGAQYGLENAPWDMRALDRFEQNAGKRVSVLHFGQSFRNSDGSDSVFPAARMQVLRERGIIPLLNYAPQQSGRGVEQPDFQLSDIVEGRHDAYLRRYAAAVAAWGHPFFLRFAHEMNGAWYAWSELRNGNNAGEFVRAWRHVHDIFRAQGAGNATWVWCPNIEYWGTIKPLSSLYPGDAYVDWTCLDGYNWGTDPAKPDAWRSFEQLFRASYGVVAETIAPDKPLMIGETGSTEIGGSKATWLRNALLTEIPRFPRLKAFLYFNLHDDGVDWQIESSPSAQAAFAQGIASNTYAGR